MYELIILCYLARWPMHGYLIAKIINDMIGPYARLSNGRLYPLLTKLENAGLIARAEEPEEAEELSGAHARAQITVQSRQSGGRRQRPYTITAAGRARFHQLMMDTTSNVGEYARIFWFKLPCMYLLSLNEQVYLLDHFITYCQTHIFHLQAESEDLRRHVAEYWQAAPEQGEGSLFAMDFALRRWRLELERAQQWRTHVVALAEGTEQATLADSSDLTRNS